MIAVHTDIEGLKQTAIELLETGLERAARAKDARPFCRTAVREVASSEPYVVRVEYLARLQHAIELMPSLHLTADDVVGIDAIERARAEFHRNHPACWRCGALRVAKNWDICWSCDKPYKLEVKK